MEITDGLILVVNAVIVLPLLISSRMSPSLPPLPNTVEGRHTYIEEESCLGAHIVERIRYALLVHVRAICSCPSISSTFSFSAVAAIPTLPSET
jgi:hypothetical protein